MRAPARRFSGLYTVVVILLLLLKLCNKLFLLIRGGRSDLTLRPQTTGATRLNLSRLGNAAGRGGSSRTL